jgi:hypothetical protein
MTQRPIFLADASAARLAVLDVLLAGDHFEGSIDVERLPEGLRHLFAELEEVVEGQVFSLLDQTEDRIRNAGLRVLWEGGASTPVSDLQVFPSTGAVSFRATPPPALPLNGSAAAGHHTTRLP